MTPKPWAIFAAPTAGIGWTAAVTDSAQAPLVERELNTAIPSTWCVVACEQGCTETWTVDVADFEPRLTAADVEQMLTSLLIAHEVEHGKW